VPPHARRAEIFRLILIALFFLAAPTAGDIGSCSQPEDALDPEKFFRAKQAVDCQRCTECGLTTDTCQSACTTAPALDDFPPGCVPVVHDGDVCIAALLHSSCVDYAPYVDDQAPTLPTECNFCPPEAKPP